MSAALQRLQESAIGPYEPIAKATGVADGFANRLALGFSLRNQDPVLAEHYLVETLSAWPILCRVMAELEAAYPEQAARAAPEAVRMIELLDRRDGKGDHA